METENPGAVGGVGEGGAAVPNATLSPRNDCALRWAEGEPC